MDDVKAEWLVRKIAPESRLVRTWPLAGGISAGMTALEIERPGGQISQLILRQPAAAALKRNPHCARDEFRLLRILTSLGLPVPEPVYLDETREIIPAPLILISYIEGTLEFSPPNLADYVHQMADALLQIHSVGGARPDLAFLPRLAGSYLDVCGSRPIKVNQFLEEGCIRDILEAAWPFPQDNPPTLLHGDFWPGNLLWQNRRLAGVIDWEDARIGDPLSDLAISRLDILWIFGREAMDEFTRRYLSRMVIDVTSLPYWDLRSALRLVRLAGDHLDEWAAFFQPFGRQDITGASIREHYHDFINQAFDHLAG